MIKGKASHCEAFFLTYFAVKDDDWGSGHGNRDSRCFFWSPGFLLARLLPLGNPSLLPDE